MSETLTAIYEIIEEDLDGLTDTGDGLSFVTDARYGEVTIEIDHDPEAESIRVSAGVAPPAGAGRSFLVWCLALNTRYWDVKVGLADDGRLLVHSDLVAEEGAEPDALAIEVVDRAETVIELLDDDLVGWLLEHALGTPAQIERWTQWATSDDDEDEAEAE